MTADEKNIDKNKILSVKGLDDRIDAYAAIIKQAKNEIDILDFDLDKRIFDHKEIYSKLKQTAIESKRARIRILVHSAQNTIKDSRHLIYLIEKLSSHFELRELNPDDQKFAQHNFIIADNLGFCQTRNEAPYEGRAELHNRATAQELTILFERLWENANRSTDLLRLHI